MPLVSTEPYVLGVSTIALATAQFKREWSEAYLLPYMSTEIGPLVCQLLALLGPLFGVDSFSPCKSCSYTLWVMRTRFVVTICVYELKKVSRGW